MAVPRVIEVDVSGGYVVENGERIDPFDVVDSLQGSGDRILLHDIDGRRRSKHQLDMIQDLSAEIGIWYDGSIRRADNLIDPIVAGAEKVVVDIGLFTIAEFETAIRITDRVVVDVDFEHGDRVRDAEFSGQTAQGLRYLFNMGYSDFILSQEKFENLVESIGGADVNLWFRGDQQTNLLHPAPGKSMPRGVNVCGRIAPLDELVEKND